MAELIKDRCACVILNYNDALTTKKLVSRIKNYDVIGHIIIVDNCSTDNSYNELISMSSSKIIVDKNLTNAGYGAGNNKGVYWALNVLNYKYVLISNPDVEFEEKVVRSLLDCLNSVHNSAAVGPVQLDIKKKVIKHVAWKIPSVYQYIFTAEVLCSKIFRANHYKKKYLNSNPRVQVECLPGAFLLVDAIAFTKVGGYDENMFLYCEETTLGYKFKEAGYKTYLITDVKYVHQHSISINKSISSIINQKRMILKNRRYFIEKYLSANKLELLLADIVFGISIIETMLIQEIRKIITHRE